DLVAPPLQGPTEPGLGPPVVVLPAVVEEGDAGVDRLVDEPGGLVEGGEVAEVVPADAEDRDPLPGLPERPAGDLAGNRFWVPLRPARPLRPGCFVVHVALPSVLCNSRTGGRECT